MALTPEEERRFARHLLLKEIGPQGQARLKNASAVVVGAGGLGSAAAMYLAAAGVGRLGIVEYDRVEASNFNRQILYGPADEGKAKIGAARERLSALRPEMRLELHEVKLTHENAAEIFRSYDVVLDGTDNFPARYALHDTCVSLGKPSVYGAVRRFEGEVSVFDTKRGPCYRCLYPVPPQEGSIPGSARTGVFGVLPGVIGTIQAAEALKLLLGAGDPLIGRLLLYDALKAEFREIRVGKTPACPTCSSV